MEWWNKVMISVRRVWYDVAARLGVRRNGLLKLRHDVRACEYEDVRVMWQMLEANETGHGRISAKTIKRPFWDFCDWAKRAPNLCRRHEWHF